MKPMKIRKSKTNTNALTNSALELLTLAGCEVWRSNNSPIPTGRMKDNKPEFRRFRGKRGLPDIIGWKLEDIREYSLSSGEPKVKHRNIATFIGVEIKTGSDKVSKEQHEFFNKLFHDGGIYFLVKGETINLERALRAMGWLK